MEIYEINQYDLADLLVTAAEIRAQKALQRAGITDPLISRTQAIKRHTENNIKLWERMGIIKRIQKGHGATIYFSVDELNKVSFSQDRKRYVTAKERRL